MLVLVDVEDRDTVMSVTGTAERPNLPSDHASLARCWEERA